MCTFYSLSSLQHVSTDLNRIFLRTIGYTETNTELPKRIELRFFLNPTSFESMVSNGNSLGALVCERTRLEGDAGRQKCVGTGTFVKIPASLALVSIGYKSQAIRDIEQWFDAESGVLKNEGGRVEYRTAEKGGLYTSGWLKRGPSGIIGTNIRDANETVATIMEDLKLNRAAMSLPKGNHDGLLALLKERNVKVVDWEGYRRIEKAEYARRRSEHQPREKIVSFEEQLDASFPFIHSI